MKKILALLAVVLGVVSCQTEPEGLDVNVGGEVETTVCVSLPETTRANSAVGAVGTFNNVDWNTYTVRYIMQIFDQNGRASEAEYVAYKDGNESNNSVTFPVRLVPNRDYNFVVWADIVTDAKTDLHYNLHNGDEGALDLTNITLNNWVAMDETRDAYTGFYNTKVEGTKYSSGLPINITLKRPFAKLRVLTTDMEALANLDLRPRKAVVKYNVNHYRSFNACTGQPTNKDIAENEHTIADVATNGETGTLFVDYFFASSTEDETVRFDLLVYDQNGDADVNKIKYNNFNTDIKVRSNYLTTIQGNILTDGNNVTVTVEDAFEGKTEWPDKNNNAEQLAYAAMFGGKVTLTENITLTQPLKIVEGANAVINLNGWTITGAFVKGKGAIIENNGTLTLVGGTIKTTEINGDAVINNNGKRVLDGVESVGAPLGDGGYSAYTVISSGKMTINDGTKVYADRGCLKLSNGGETFINGGLFVNNDIGTRSLTSHVVDVEDGGNNNLTINGGTFEHHHTNTSGGVVICNRTEGTVYVNGGKFSGGNYYGNDNLSDYGCGGTFSVTGGTYSAKPADKYLATGYKAVQSGDKYMVVKEDVGGVATDNATLDTAIKNAQDGDTIALNAGEYVIPNSAAGKTLHFVGMGNPANTKIATNNETGSYEGCNYNLSGSTVTFENISINTTSTSYIGYAGLKATYKNCTINGFYCLYDNSTFEDCTFNVSGDNYNVWTWAAPIATFTRCTFNSDGKAMMLYGGTDTKLTVNNCTFNDNGGLVDELKAAIEVGNNYDMSYELIVNNTIVNGFAINNKGINTGTTLWANKNSMPQDKLNVIVDGVDVY